MKQIWHRRMASGFLNFLLLFLCQPVSKAFSQPPSDEIEESECESGFESRPLQENYAANFTYAHNYLMRHLPDTDKRLTEERERELIYLYQKETNPRIKEGILITLLSSHINLIRSLAYKAARSWGREDFAEDLIQDTVIFFTDHLKKHDPEKSRINFYILSYAPKMMSKKLSRYISPVLVSERYQEEIRESESIMTPMAFELSTYKPDTGDNIDENNIEDSHLKPVESWAEANESIKQIKDFILALGNTPRQRYILRHRIFSFEPEPSHSIAEKFEIHPSGVAIRVEEKKLIERISALLGNGSLIEQDQIFTEVSRIIEKGNQFPLVNDNEMDWQTEDMAKQIKYLIQEMDSTPEQRNILKNQQAENLAKEAELDEINKYILRYRLMEKPWRTTNSNSY